MIDQDLLRIDVQSFCEAYSFKEAVAYDKKIERALTYSFADNSREYNLLFFKEIYKGFKAKLANQLLVCHGKGCSACDYYKNCISIIYQFQATF
ncbi:hypothetical protein WBG78_10760 [Chryseolinea sp. T2]|uniref:hypothetical protein n=1 Tax=Chryseolinea sp. T2 TaxID=3129255 RepID=UPI003077E452